MLGTVSSFQTVISEIDIRFSSDHCKKNSAAHDSRLPSVHQISALSVYVTYISSHSKLKGSIFQSLPPRSGWSHHCVPGELSIRLPSHVQTCLWLISYAGGRCEQLSGMLIAAGRCYPVRYLILFDSIKVLAGTGLEWTSWPGKIWEQFLFWLCAAFNCGCTHYSGDSQWCSTFRHNLSNWIASHIQR
jgi:hypothetical protein